jgi:Cu+-exporting ATPase
VFFARLAVGEEHAFPISSTESTMAIMTISKDPVCGMNIDTTKEHATSQHQGETYHFCSAACKEKFDRSPALYAARKTAH